MNGISLTSAKGKAKINRHFRLNIILMTFIYHFSGKGMSKVHDPANLRSRFKSLIKIFNEKLLKTIYVRSFL